MKHSYTLLKVLQYEGQNICKTNKYYTKSVKD
jgi:hypothetical protein